MSHDHQHHVTWWTPGTCVLDSFHRSQVRQLCDNWSFLPDISCMSLKKLKKEKIFHIYFCTLSILLQTWTICCVPVCRSGSSRHFDFWHVSGLLPRWPSTQTSPCCHLCCLLLRRSFHDDWSKNKLHYRSPLPAFCLCLCWSHDMSHTGGPVHLPVVWLLRLQWNDPAFVCHSSVCVRHVDLWSVNK